MAVHRQRPSIPQPAVGGQARQRGRTAPRDGSCAHWHPACYSCPCRHSHRRCSSGHSCGHHPCCWCSCCTRCRRWRKAGRRTSRTTAASTKCRRRSITITVDVLLHASSGGGGSTWQLGSAAIGLGKCDCGCGCAPHPSSSFSWLSGQAMHCNPVAGTRLLPLVGTFPFPMLARPVPCRHHRPRLP